MNAKKYKIYAVIVFTGLAAGLFLGYAINVGLGMDPTHNLHIWGVGSVVVLFVRLKMSSTFKHLL